MLPILRTLAGRNCLLNSLAEATFTCAAALSDSKAVVCSEKGDICILVDNDGQSLTKVAHADFSITCAAVDHRNRVVLVGGADGQKRSLNFDELQVPGTPPESPTSDRPDAMIVTTEQQGSFCAIGLSARSVISIHSNHGIKILRDTIDDLPASTVTLSAHGVPVLGVRALCQPNEVDAAFYTWDAGGSIMFWDIEGQPAGSPLQVPLEQYKGEDAMRNQCQIVQSSKSPSFFITGDKYGSMKIILRPTRECVYDIKAHASEIMDIDIYEGDSLPLIATSGRDRTVQLFRYSGQVWAHLQTMDEHKGSVCNVKFSENGQKLVSCSTDRTIIVRHLISKDNDEQQVLAAVPFRTINLKASPVSMIMSSHTDSLLISLLDRTVATYDVESGRLISSFKASDCECNDAVVMDALVMSRPGDLSGRPAVLAGVSSTDKSVRIYDASTGSFIDREFGHTEGVSGVELVQETDDKMTYVSTGFDGTIMIWHLVGRHPDLQEPFENTPGPGDTSPVKESAFVRAPPLRRVLSRAELAEFQRPIASQTSTPTGRSSPPRPLRRKTSKYGLASQPSPNLVPPPMPKLPSFQSGSFSAEDTASRKQSLRTRSRSPPPSPKTRQANSARGSAWHLRGRTKSTSGGSGGGNGSSASEFGSLNMATEQTIRMLRSYRKKLSSTETVREELLKELDGELRLTAKAVGDRVGRGFSDVVLTGLLDQYSERLVEMFEGKLRLGNLGKGLEEEDRAVEQLVDKDGVPTKEVIGEAAVTPSKVLLSPPLMASPTIVEPPQ